MAHDAVTEVREISDIVELVSHYVQLKKAGRSYKGLCPFHAEKTPSFVVFPESQHWHCFGACGEGGDVFTFVMKQEGWDFRTALEELARRAGVELQPHTPAQVRAEEEADRVAEGISRHEPPERVIPEEPQHTDFLSALTGAAEAEAERQKDAPQTVEPLAVYAGDLDYAREALLELSEQDESVAEPKWQSHLEGFTLSPPPDLRRRFEYLPPELRHGTGWELKLTAQRDLVQDALARSRQQKDRWPEWQLLWELHPVMEWLNDRFWPTSGATKRRWCALPRASAPVRLRLCSRAC